MKQRVFNQDQIADATLRGAKTAAKNETQAELARLMGHRPPLTRDDIIERLRFFVKGSPASDPNAPADAELEPRELQYTSRRVYC